MRRTAVFHTAALVVLALPTALGCASTASSAKPQLATPAPSTATSPASVSAPSPANTPEASRSAGPVSQPSTSGCLAHASILYPGSDNPLRRVCIRVGGTVTITLTVTGAYRWSTPATTNPAAAAIGDVHTDADGTLHAVVTAQAPGTGTISAADTFTPDPHGPPSHLWTLIMTVMP